MFPDTSQKQVDGVRERWGLRGLRVRPFLRRANQLRYFTRSRCDVTELLIRGPCVSSPETFLEGVREQRERRVGVRLQNLQINSGSNGQMMPTEASNRKRCLYVCFLEGQPVANRPKDQHVLASRCLVGLMLKTFGAAKRTFLRYFCVGPQSGASSELSESGTRYISAVWPFHFFRQTELIVLDL